MSNLTKAEREKLPLSDFGAPDQRLFPILDQSDVDAASHLIGKAKNPAAVKARVIAIAKRKGFKVPDAWQVAAKMSAELAFADDGRRVDGDWAIYPNSLLFISGLYADKNFELSPEEMWAAVEQFTPVGGNIEHTDFLQGRACEVRSIRLDPVDSEILRGEVAVPLWLDENLGDREKRLSCEWDRETKTLAGIGLVVNPRVPEATLMAAFAAARHDTPHGQMALTDIHNAATRGGAVCQKPAANMASRHESNAIQMAHDVVAASGATCAAMKPGDMRPGPSMYANEPGGKPAGKERSSMSDNFEKFMAWLKGEEPNTEAAAQTSVTPPSVAATTPPAAVTASAIATPDPQVAEMARVRAESERLAQENRELKARHIAERAAAFAAQMLREGRAVPAEEAAIVAAFTQAATDDMTIGTVTFADGTTAKTRVELLKSAYSVRLPHQLTQEHVLNDIYAVANQIKTTKPSEGKPSAERVSELIGMTATGAAFLRDQKNGSN